MKKMFTIFRKPKAKGAKFDVQLRHSIEITRRDAEEEDYKSLSDDLKKTVGFTKEEKQDFYRQRLLMGWLPITGPNGGWVQRIADNVTEHTGLACSRQYAHQSLFPEDPGSLFASRSIVYKRIWIELKALISEAMKNQKVSAYAHILDHLHKGRMVWVQNMKSTRLEILRKKIVRTAGFTRVVAHKFSGKVPFDFLFVPEKGTAALLVKDATDTVENILVQKMPVEVLGFNRLLIDEMFPAPFTKKRLGNNHYLIQEEEPKSPANE